MRLRSRVKSTVSVTECMIIDNRPNAVEVRRREFFTKPHFSTFKTGNVGIGGA